MAKHSAGEKREEEIVDRTSPPGEIVYQAIYREGEHELERFGEALSTLRSSNRRLFCAAHRDQAL